MNVYIDGTREGLPRGNKYQFINEDLITIRTSYGAWMARWKREKERDTQTHTYRYSLWNVKLGIQWKGLCGRLLPLARKSERKIEREKERHERERKGREGRGPYVVQFNNSIATSAFVFVFPRRAVGNARHISRVWSPRSSYIIWC